MIDARAECVTILARFYQGELSAPVALMQMLIAAEDHARVARVVEGETSPRAWELRALLKDNEKGCARIASMLRSDMDRPPLGATAQEGVAFCRRLFDWSVRQSEEASVALYSLGSPELLKEATAEIVALLSSWGVLGTDKDVLDIGCGIGRMEEALAPHVRRIVGIDVSEQMIAAAKRRCVGLSHVTLATASGLDLREYDDASFDAVLAVDSFPYLVQSGMALVTTHFVETSRVLRTGGQFVILNFSYRDAIEEDRADVARLATECAFDTIVVGNKPFRLWDGAAFRMKKAQDV